jgi:phage repressor protein C with HTH and peptisase S24 domain
MSNDAVRARLDALISAKGEDYSSISRLIGRNSAYIQQFIKRGVPRKLAENDRRRIASYFGVSEEELGGPAAETPDNGLSADFVLVSRFNVGASAGPGALADSEHVTDSLAFRGEWLRRMALGHPRNLSVIRVTGDSMFPTLSDGDEILVDASDAAERLRDGIYVLRVDGAVMVKRLAVNPAGGGFTVTSDNPAYPPWTGLDLDTVAVIGRVVWMGRRIN